MRLQKPRPKTLLLYAPFAVGAPHTLEYLFIHAEHSRKPAVRAPHEIAHLSDDGRQDGHPHQGEIRLSPVEQTTTTTSTPFAPIVLETTDGQDRLVCQHWVVTGFTP